MTIGKCEKCEKIKPCNLRYYGIKKLNLCNACRKNFIQEISAGLGKVIEILATETEEKSE